MGAKVAHSDALGVSVELKDNKLRSIIHTKCSSLFRHKVLGVTSTFHSIGQGNGCMSSFNLHHRGLVDASHGKDAFKHFPGILLDLLVSQAHATIFLVKFKNDNLNFITHIAELGRMLDLFGPAQIRDVNQSINSFFKLHEQAKVGEVANGSFLLGLDWIAPLNVLPRVHRQLFESQ